MVLGCKVEAHVGPPSPAATEPPPETESQTALALVPRPRAMKTCAGALSPTPSMRVSFEGDARPIAARLAAWLGVAEPNAGDRGDILLTLDGNDARDTARDVATDEAYVLDVDARGATVRARSKAGLFYGAQTLAKLAGVRTIEGSGARASAHEIPCVHIEDAPRFAYRGMHLDVARHFFAKDVVLRYVDLLAFYKLNVFHWHLTDDQGFRLRLPKHPELATEPAYTEADVREVVAYARDRFVTVVPEIEMPGHARAILASHPELSCAGVRLPLPTTWGVFEDVLCPGNPATLALVDDVLGDVAALFPSRIIHIGGDEVPTTRWSSCPKCRARMKAENLSAAQLEGAFLRDVAARLARRDRRTAVWDDALDSGLPDDAIVFAWRNDKRGEEAARAGHDVVMTPQDWVYFDRRQSRSSSEPGPYAVVGWPQVYLYDPERGINESIRSRLLGAEGALWTEYVTTPADVDRRLLPRLAALSEVVWSPAKLDRSYAMDGFTKRFTAERGMLDAARVQYFVDPPELPAKKVFVSSHSLPMRSSPWIFPDAAIRYTRDGSDPTPTSPRVDGPIHVAETTDLAARTFLPDGRTSDVAHARLELQSLSPARAVTAPVSGVDYKYYEGDFHRLPSFATLTPIRAATRADVALEPTFRATGFAVLYEGLGKVDEDAIYRCYTRSDDGVRLFVDGRLVVDDDGEHAAREAAGEVALAAGWHAVRVEYFQSAGGKELSARCASMSALAIDRP
jgi:hexosaminidase